MKIKTHNSKKLFYKKYLYKINFDFAVGHIFRTYHQRDGALGYAKDMIDTYREKLKNSSYIEKGVYTKVRFGLEEIHDAEILKSALLNVEDYIVRHEYHYSFMIYTNNKDPILEVADKFKTIKLIEVWEPTETAKDLLLTVPNILISKMAKDFEYKVTIDAGAAKRKNSPLTKWIAANRDKIKITDYSLNHAFSYTGIYVRDSKVLMLLQMTGNDYITKIEKLVSPS
jgi:hypothetical protein